MDSRPDTSIASSPSAVSTRTPRAHAAWLVLLLLAATELVAQYVVSARVPAPSDWERAAAHVRSAFQEGDAVASAPHWADPLMRSAMGETLPVSVAARSDLAPYTRLWVFSIRGHAARELPPDSVPTETHQFGGVRVELHALPRPVEVVYELTEHVADARVVLAQGDQERECRFARGRASGGGLGAGPITPAERHICDASRPWLWVGATVEEDLDMLPRRCVWQHPAGGDEIVRTSYTDVELGTRVILFAGLWWEHERTLDGGPVDVVVRIEGEVVGRLVHEDGDGWKRIEAEVPEALRGGRGRVDIEVSSPAPHLRTLCWAARTERDR